MVKIDRFEKLEVWQEARKIVNEIYKLTLNKNFKKDFSFIDQMRRSSVSVMANIAEGFHRGSNKDFVKFLGYSRASLAETRSHLYVALDQSYIDKNEANQIGQQVDILWKKINNFISYLKK